MSWLSSLFGQKRRPKGRAPQHAGDDLPFSAPLDTDESIAIIGDVHGQADLLDRLLDQLSKEPVNRLVFVGDYVDRGEDSARVLEILMRLGADAPQHVFLKGNHEKMMLDFIDRPRERAERWVRNGGLQTLASFGLHDLRVSMTDDELSSAAEEFRNALPPRCEDWVRSLGLSYQTGNLWVVHAAAAPDQPVDGQSDRILLWGHRDFGKRPRQDGQWIAHGHTVVPEPICGDGIISVDTGAYATGRLTAAIVSPGEPVRFSST